MEYHFVKNQSINRGILAVIFWVLGIGIYNDIHNSAIITVLIRPPNIYLDKLLKFINVYPVNSGIL